MASQPPIIPVTQQGAGVQASPAARVLFQKAQEAFRLALSQKRPWAEMADRSQFAKPESLSEATVRVRKNMSHFRINYSLVLIAVVALSLVMHPVYLFVLGSLLAAWVYLYLVRTDPVIAFGRTFSEREVLLGMSVFTLIVIFMTNVGSILISAFMIGVGLCAAHGAYRVPDDLFLDDQEATGGFLSFLSSGNGGPAVVSHV